MQAIRVHQPGGPEVLRIEELPTPRPGPNEVLIKVAVAGVNFADVGLRRGMMGGPHAVELPYTPGFEVAGTIAATGAGVADLRDGDRVVAVLEHGGYAEYAVAPVAKTQRIPDGVDWVQATALLVQGLTAYGVLHDSARLQPGESVLIQAAAGGVGSLAVQLAKLAGAGTVVGTASSERKRDFILSLGADHALDYGQPDWVDHVYDALGGRGVDVVLESVGGTLGGQAFHTLAPLGRFVMFGAAGGPLVPPPNLMVLSFKGQAVMGYGGPWIRPGAADVARAAIAEYLARGQLHVTTGRSFALADAAEAHRAIEARQTIGKVVLEVA